MSLLSCQRTCGFFRLTAITIPYSVLKSELDDVFTMSAFEVSGDREFCRIHALALKEDSVGIPLDCPRSYWFSQVEMRVFYPYFACLGVQSLILDRLLKNHQLDTIHDTLPNPMNCGSPTAEDGILLYQPCISGLFSGASRSRSGLVLSSDLSFFFVPFLFFFLLFSFFSFVLNHHHRRRFFFFFFSLLLLLFFVFIFSCIPSISSFLSLLTYFLLHAHYQHLYSFFFTLSFFIPSFNYRRSLITLLFESHQPPSLPL